MVKVSKDNKPLMKFKGMTSTLAADRISLLSDRRLISADLVESWILKSNKTQDDTETDKTQSSATSEKKMRKPLIHKLAATVQTEIPDLEFDYFAMHSSCRELLLRLQTEEEGVTGPGFTKKYMSHGENNLAFVAGFVLSTAAGKKGNIDTSVSSTQLLEIAAETVNQWLSEGKGKTISGTGNEQPDLQLR